MSKYVACPFYKYDRENKIACEDMTLTFADRKQLRRYLKERCGNIKGYKNCVLARKTNKKYEED